MSPTHHDRRPSHPEVSKQFELVILQGLSVVHVKYWTRHLVTKSGREPACCGKYKTVATQFFSGIYRQMPCYLRATWCCVKIPVEAVEEQLATWRDATWRLSMVYQRVLQVLIGSRPSIYHHIHT